MKRVLMATLIAAAVACGYPQSAAPKPWTTATVTPGQAKTAEPSPPAVSSPTASGPTLYAVVEDKAHPGGLGFDTIAIADLNGIARAKATFTPMRVPTTGCYGGTPMPIPATTAAGAAFFADSTGVVRKLGVDGSVTTITTFPVVSAQQVLSFVVSPDGAHLLGAILTLAPRPAGDPCGPNAKFSFLYGDPTNDVYSADAGAAPRLLYHETWSPSAQTPTTLLVLKSWTAAGPRGTYPSIIALQGAGPTGADGTAVRVDPVTGKVLGPVVQSTCILPVVAASGDYSCLPSDVLSRDADSSMIVFRPDGTELWRGVAKGEDRYGHGLLAPDESHLVTFASIIGRDASRSPIPAVFPMGWVDSRTLLVFDNRMSPGSGATGYISLDDPSKVVNLGFDGHFAGNINER